MMEYHAGTAAPASLPKVADSESVRNRQRLESIRGALEAFASRLESLRNSLCNSTNSVYGLDQPVAPSMFNNNNNVSGMSEPLQPDLVSSMSKLVSDIDSLLNAVEYQASRLP
jgi:hypothetical protein